MTVRPIKNFMRSSDFGLGLALGVSGCFTVSQIIQKDFLCVEYVNSKHFKANRIIGLILL